MPVVNTRIAEVTYSSNPPLAPEEMPSIYSTHAKAKAYYSYYDGMRKHYIFIKSRAEAVAKRLTGELHEAGYQAALRDFPDESV